jgi:hypothetical protein
LARGRTGEAAIRGRFTLRRLEIARRAELIRALLDAFFGVPDAVGELAAVCAATEKASANPAASATTVANRIMYLLGPAELLSDQGSVYGEVDHRRLPIIVLDQQHIGHGMAILHLGPHANGQIAGIVGKPGARMSRSSRSTTSAPSQPMRISSNTTASTGVFPVRLRLATIGSISDAAGSPSARNVIRHGYPGAISAST